MISGIGHILPSHLHQFPSKFRASGQVFTWLVHVIGTGTEVKCVSVLSALLLAIKEISCWGLFSFLSLNLARALMY